MKSLSTAVRIHLFLIGSIGGTEMSKNRKRQSYRTMKQFYTAYSQPKFLQQAVAELSRTRVWMPGQARHDKSSEDNSSN